MVEMITVIDRERNVLGVKSREVVHVDGDWHETFQCWFIEQVEGSFYIYLQLRSAGKKDFPSMYDITAAGHLLAGETVVDGVREIKEELGVSVQMDELTFLEAIPNSIVLPGFVDNEISLVHLYEVKDKVAFVFEDQEVEAIIRMRLADFKKLCNSKLEAASFELYKFGEFIEATDRIEFKQLVPHEHSYFGKVIREIEKYIYKLNI